jgi:hypothetical protein
LILPPGTLKTACRSCKRRCAKSLGTPILTRNMQSSPA